MDLEYSKLLTKCQTCCQDLYLGPKTKTFTFKSQVKTNTFRQWVSGQDQDFRTRVKSNQIKSNNGLLQQKINYNNLWSHE